MLSIMMSLSFQKNLNSESLYSTFPYEGIYSFSLFSTSGSQLLPPHLDTQPTQHVASQIEAPNKILYYNPLLTSTLISPSFQNNLNARESLDSTFLHEGLLKRYQWQHRK